MLEFIVLGQVPGTSFIITFSWAVAVITVMVGSTMLTKAHHHDQTQQVSIEELAI